MGWFGRVGGLVGWFWGFLFVSVGSLGVLGWFEVGG
jgi:hypothetical protein